MKKRYANSEKAYKIKAKEVLPLIMSLIKDKSKDAKEKESDEKINFIYRSNYVKY